MSFTGKAYMHTQQVTMQKKSLKQNYTAKQVVA